MNLTRREMLTSTAAAGLASVAGTWGAEEKVRLGVASYSLRKFKRPQAIEMVKACGVRYVNIKSFHLPYTLSPEELKAGRKEFDDAGLKVVGSGNNGIKKEADIETVFPEGQTCCAYQASWNAPDGRRRQPKPSASAPSSMMPTTASSNVTGAAEASNPIFASHGAAASATTSWILAALSASTCSSG